VFGIREVRHAPSAHHRNRAGAANPSVPPTLTPGSRVIGNAPVGHRQPRAADVPSSTESPADSAADKALDRKIKSICRGC
jgi:hypothetical protein